MPGDVPENDYAELIAKVAVLESKHDATDRTLHDLDDKVDKASERIAVMEANYVNMDSKLDNLSDKMDAVLERLDKGGTMIATNQNKIDELERRIDKHDKWRIAMVGTALAAFGAAIGSYFFGGGR